jgi:hypothetical protein
MPRVRGPDCEAIIAGLLGRQRLLCGSLPGVLLDNKPVDSAGFSTQAPPRSPRTLLGAVALVALVSGIGACGGGTQGTPAETTQATAPKPTAAPAEAEAPLPPPVFEAALPEAVRSIITKPFTGDFNQMVSRRLIRVGVTRNRTFYFVDKSVQRQPEKGASRSSTALS